MLTIFFIFVILIVSQSSDDATGTTVGGHTRQICISQDRLLRAKSKSCFLRADTGPCRADIPQWYYDSKKGRCYRFFYGGCQGNGNRFETRAECIEHCFLNETSPEQKKRPYYCDMKFEYGSCFGHFNRWTWDRFSGVCKRRLYSGCGGNQNNFETLFECQKTCLMMPNSTLGMLYQFTTCIPYQVPDIF